MAPLQLYSAHFGTRQSTEALHGIILNEDGSILAAGHTDGSLAGSNLGEHRVSFHLHSNRAERSKPIVFPTHVYVLLPFSGKSDGFIVRFDASTGAKSSVRLDLPPTPPPPCNPMPTNPHPTPRQRLML